MSDELYVDTDGLRNAAGSLSQLTTQVVGIANQLQGTLGALGEPWGDDDTGQQFASKYLGPADQIMQGINSIGSVLDSTVQGLGTMANGYSATEEENRSSIKLASDSSQSGADQTYLAERDVAPMMVRAEAVAAQPVEAVRDTPAQPGDLLAREEAPLESEFSAATPAQPAERLEAREADTPLQLAERMDAEEPGEPLQPAERLAAEEPETPLQPTERFAAAEPGEPLQPTLSDREAAQPLQPMEALTPRLDDTPAQPAERVAATRATSTPMQPAQPLMAREDDVAARNDGSTALTPAQPRETLAGEDDVPAQNGTPLQPVLSDRVSAQPLQPAEPAQPGKPALPGERLAPRQADTPAQPAQSAKPAERVKATRATSTTRQSRRAHQSQTPARQTSTHEGRPRKDSTPSQAREVRRDEPADS